MMNHTDLNQTVGLVGGIVFLIENLSSVLPYTLLMVFGVTAGLIGNTMIIGAVITNRELHSATNMLVFNLALADLVISAFVNSFTLVGILVGEGWFIKNIAFCRFIAAVCLIACETSLMNIGFLAFNRYINICMHPYYSKLFTNKRTVIYCAITWTIGVLITLPDFFGWGGLYYDKKALNCVWNRLASHSYSLFFPLSSIVTPCVCIFICYIRIFLFATSAKRKISGAVSSSQAKSSREMNKSFRLAKGLFASFMLFTLCWLPYGLVVMIDHGDNFPPGAHAYTMALAHLNSSFNPILYAIANPAFQRGYKQFLCLILNQTPVVSHATKSLNSPSNHKGAQNSAAGPASAIKY